MNVPIHTQGGREYRRGANTETQAGANAHLIHKGTKKNTKREEAQAGQVIGGISASLTYRLMNVCVCVCVPVCVWVCVCVRKCDKPTVCFGAAEQPLPFVTVSCQEEKLQCCWEKRHVKFDR